jgi:pimeloyl-ACP methyl ester carboxylesterase
VDPEERDVTIGDDRIHLLESGDPQGPAFLLLHGWPQSGAEWLGVMAAAGSQARMIAADLPGIGGSGPTGTGGSKVATAAVVDALLEELDLSDVTLVGHDAGGMVAYAYLRRHSRAARVAIVETAVPGVEPWSTVIANPYVWHFGFHALPDLPELLVAGHEARYFDYFFDVLSPDPSRIPAAARARYTAAYQPVDKLRAGFDHYRALGQDAKDNEESAAGPAADTPLLYVRGAGSGVEIDDYLVGFRAAGVRDVEGRIIDDAGHFVADEQPEVLWRALATFAGIDET